MSQSKQKEEHQFHTLNIALVGGRGVRLGYKTEAAALEVHAFLKEVVKGEEPQLTTMSDDFGNVFTLTASTMIESMLVTNIAKDFEILQEIELAKARATAYLQRRAKSDPVLSGPQIVSVPGDILKGPSGPFNA